MNTQDIVIIIGVFTTSAISIINTIGLFWGKRDIKKRINRANMRLIKAEDSRFHVARQISSQLDDARKTLETVESNTNGTVTKALERITELESAVTKALAVNKPEEKDKVIVETLTNGKP